MKLLILGPAGSGKGTQAKLISEHYKIPHISTGDLIREEIASGSVFGKKLEQLINKGNLVSDEDVLKLLKQRLDASKSGFILDGYPRNLNQAKTLDKITTINAVIFLDVKRKIIIKRNISDNREKKALLDILGKIDKSWQDPKSYNSKDVKLLVYKNNTKQDLENIKVSLRKLLK